MPTAAPIAVKTVHNASASAALAAVLVSSRRGRGAPQTDQRSGRLDRRRLARAACGDGRVFTRRSAPQPERVRVYILLDASISMGGAIGGAQDNPLRWTTRQQVCGQIGRDLAGACDLLPWVKAKIVAYTTKWDGVALYPIWETGDDRSHIDSYGTIRRGSTEEGYALAYMGDEMEEQIKKGERPLIIIVSDGEPGEQAHVTSVVQDLAARHIPVVSVDLVNSKQQVPMYGRDNVVRYNGSVPALARDMAKAIGKVL